MQDKSEIRYVETDCGVIMYELTLKKVKNLYLRILPDCTIHVSANYRVGKKNIDNFIKSKSEYINRTIKKFGERRKETSTVEYLNGESIFFLGKRIKLEIIEADKNEIFLKDNTLFIKTLYVADSKRKEKLVQGWYDKQCDLVFGTIALEVYESFKQYDIPFPQIKYRRMRTRWGSCQPYTNIVTLNKVLLKMPSECIKYVIMHEFTHFIYPNHSKDFYLFLEALMPDWKEIKEKMNMYV